DGGAATGGADVGRGAAEAVPDGGAATGGADVGRGATAPPAAQADRQPPVEVLPEPSSLLQDAAVLVRLEPTPDRPVPLGSYWLLARVADGGMAEIFVAAPRSGTDRTLVALKRLQPHLARDPHIHRCFAEEARITAALTHPNVVTIFEQQLDEWGIPFIAMEFLPGATLKGVIRASLSRGEMPPLGFCVWVVSRVCRALLHAHEQGVDGMPVVHGDVSPENILVTYGGQVKLLDFGVAHAMGRHAEETETIQGKLSYMAPEQAFRRPTGPWTDQFSLGIVLFELITGRRLFRQHRSLESMRKALSRPVPLAHGINPRVPLQLDRLVARACALDPRSRFSGCKEMLVELERFLVDSGHFLGDEEIARYMQDLFAEDFRAYREWLRQMVPGGPALPQSEHRLPSPFQVQARRALSLSDTAEFAVPAVEAAKHERQHDRLRANLLLGILLAAVLAAALAVVQLNERRLASSRAGESLLPAPALAPPHLEMPPTGATLPGTPRAAPGWAAPTEVPPLPPPGWLAVDDSAAMRPFLPPPDTIAAATAPEGTWLAAGAIALPPAPALPAEATELAPWASASTPDAIAAAPVPAAAPPPPSPARPPAAAPPPPSPARPP
ncbi:MAG: serine/threonine protein kinase, partial [Deltaproteobacteria bacterium]|nr:serine/threonine protein kinase [Deltaproteobacteria bacterium]